MKKEELLEFCRNNIPYYKRNLPQGIKSFEEIPFVTQMQIRENYTDFISDKKTYKLKKTSGSSGIAMKIAYNDEDEIKSKFAMYYLRYKLHGISPDDKFVSFMNSDPVNISCLEKKHLALSNINISDDTMPLYYKLIDEFQPVWIFLRPSIGVLLAKYIQENRKPIFSSLKYIELSGEYLSNSTKEYIKNVFKVPTYNMYGCMESNGIAYECRCGNLHVLSDNVLMEVVNDGVPVIDEVGNIAITTLNNTTMPFIRYLNGDMGKISSKACECGNKNKVLELIQCRNKDAIILPNNSKKDLASLDYIIHRINEYCNEIIMQSQFEQLSAFEFIVRIVLDKNINVDYDIKDFESLFHQYSKETGLDHVSWKVEVVERILPEVTTGKLRFFIDSNKK